jgi:hypothetical protein
VSPSGASQRRRETTLSQAKVSRERQKGRVTGKKRKARERGGDKALSPEKKKGGGSRVEREIEWIINRGERVEREAGIK